MCKLHLGDYLENNMDMYNWILSQLEGRRYNILTINIMKSVNSFMREPWKFPITYLVDHFRTYYNSCYDGKTMASSMSTHLATS